MKLKELHKRLENKDFFRNLKNLDKDLFLISVFCFLSKNEKESDKITFNFYSPLKKKFFSSDYPFFEIKELEEKEINEKPLSLDKLKIDIEDLWEKVESISKEKKPLKAICFLVADGWKIRIFYEDLKLKKVDISPQGDIIKVEDNNLKDSFSLKRD
ncbi:MAG: hypothetical protein QXX68_00045 [Candidatus Pacearchaeota archaeon]